MRRWLMLFAVAALVALGIWLAWSSRRPASSGGSATPATPTAEAGRRGPGPSPRVYPPASRSAPASEPAPRAGTPRGTPRFDPNLERLATALDKGTLDAEAAATGFKLDGGRVRVVVRPALGDAEKARAAIVTAGGEVIRAIGRDPSQPILVAWVPVKALRSLAENDAVKNLHRPVGLYANDPAPRAPRPAPGGEPARP